MADLLHQPAWIIIADDESDVGAWVCKTAYLDEGVANAMMDKFADEAPHNTYKLFQVIVTDDGLNVGHC